MKTTLWTLRDAQMAFQSALAYFFSAMRVGEPGRPVSLGQMRFYILTVLAFRKPCHPEAFALRPLEPVSGTGQANTVLLGRWKAKQKTNK